MTNLLITDTETTGLKVMENKVIELAFILYHLETATELVQFSSLIYTDNNPAEHINHISTSTLAAMETSRFPGMAGKAFKAAEAEADFIMAHNAPFDKGFIEAHVCKTEKPWVDSKTDITWPKQGSGSRLNYIAVDHNIPVLDAHRALGDCRTLMRLCQQAPDLLQQLKDLIGSKTYRAIVDFQQRDLAKKAGFQWDAYGKQWKRKLTDEQAAAITDFKIEELPNG